MVVVGDRKGKVGIGIGKAAEVPPAIDKATAVARKHMQKFNIISGTVNHEITGKFGTSKILLIPAKPGTGIIAGGSARAVLELAGITDVVTKVHGSTNKINVVKATIDGLSKIKSKEEIAQRRNKTVEEI
jgi:small subunit ribosomal protein S5